MAITRLGSFALRLAHKNALFQRRTFHQTKNLLRRATDKENSDDLDEPVKFSESEAARWKAEYNRTGGADDTFPWFQPYVITLSSFVFMIYFFILREENDIDEKLTMPLDHHFAGAKKQSLYNSVEQSDQRNDEYFVKR